MFKGLLPNETDIRFYNDILLATNTGKFYAYITNEEGELLKFMRVFPIKTKSVLTHGGEYYHTDCISIRLKNPNGSKISFSVSATHAIGKLFISKLASRFKLVNRDFDTKDPAKYVPSNVMIEDKRPGKWKLFTKQ